MAFNLIKGFINTAKTIRTELKDVREERREKKELKSAVQDEKDYGLDLFIKSGNSVKETNNDTSKCKCNCHNDDEVTNNNPPAEETKPEEKESFFGKIKGKITNVKEKVVNYLDEDGNGKITLDDFTEKLNNKVEEKIEKADLVHDTAKLVTEGLIFTSQNTDIHVKELLEIYTRNGDMSLIELAGTMLNHNVKDGAFLDFSNAIGDIKDIYNENFSNVEDARELVDGMQKHVDFATNKEYKKYLAEEDTLTKTSEGIETAQTCLNVCDYMNMGTMANVNNLDESWTCISDGDAIEKNSETGFWGKVYVNDESKQLIVGFCATNSISDFGTDDAQMIKAEVPEQYEDALALYNKYATDEKYSDYEIILTGHSMGGSLTQLVASTEGVKVDKAIAFNPFGTYNIQNNENDNYTFVNNDDKIYNYINEYDIVGCATRHVGQTTMLNSISMTIVGNHLLDTMHNYLNEKRAELC